MQGERKPVTVLAACLKGVTALAQAVDAEVLYDLLHRAAALMRGEVQRLEGYVTRCTGEHCIALFGAPIAQEDHVVRALHAALGIQRVLAAYADELRRTRAITLELGLGVHAGTVVIGTLDTEGSPDYTAQGFVIHLAARLQTPAAGGAIHVSEAAGNGLFPLRGPRCVHFARDRTTRARLCLYWGVPGRIAA
jgi:class 3 adenylate cyclase